MATAEGIMIKEPILCQEAQDFLAKYKDKMGLFKEEDCEGRLLYFFSINDEEKDALAIFMQSGVFEDFFIKQSVYKDELQGGINPADCCYSLTHFRDINDKPIYVPKLKNPINGLSGQWDRPIIDIANPDSTVNTLILSALGTKRGKVMYCSGLYPKTVGPKIKQKLLDTAQKIYLEYCRTSSIEFSISIREVY